MEVDRSVENVEREDPASEENMHMVYVWSQLAPACSHPHARARAQAHIRAPACVHVWRPHCRHALRSVAVAPEPVRLGEIPRSAIVSREAAVSALAAEALPHDIARTIHALSGRLAQMVDTVAVRHNDAPIVMFFPSSTKKV
ncbi:hypothetical protein EON66_06405 [archaeon]|nr:MAG: hypothetical protein EON66_06405 [archaeon]